MGHLKAAQNRLFNYKSIYLYNLFTTTKALHLHLKF